MIIHGDGFPESQRTVCWVKWLGKKWRCIGRYINVEGCPPILDFSYYSLPGLDTEHGVHCLEFDATKLTIREDPSGEATWICDEELDADACFND